MNDSLPYFPRHIAVAPTDGGAVFFSGRDAVKIEGQHAYALVARLAPFLDGTRTLAQILEPLPERNRSPVAAMIEGLLSRGILRDRSAESRDARLPEPIERDFADLIELGGRTCDQPRARFQELRAARILLLAPQELRQRVIRAVESVGVTNVEAAEAEPTHDFQRYAAVIAVSSTDSHTLASLVTRCRDQHVLLIPITLSARPDEPTPIAPGAPALIATYAARELLRAWFDRKDPADSSMLEIDLATLETRRRSVDPHTGVFIRIEEADLPQEPLNQCRATFRAPGASQSLVEVYGAGATPREARAAAHRRALEYLRPEPLAIEPGDEGWQEFIPTANDIDPPSAGVLEYLRALNVRWKIETLQWNGTTYFRFWLSEHLAAILHGSDVSRILRDGWQEIWLRAMHGGLSAPKR